MKKIKCLFGLLGALCVFSCSQRIGFAPIEPPSEDLVVRIAPVWTASQLPGALSAMVYTPQGGLQGKYDLPTEGGELKLKLPKGTYQIIVYNPNAQSVTFSSLERFDDAQGQALQQSKSGYQDIPNPGMLYSAVCGVSESVLEAHPAMLHRSSRITIKIKVDQGAMQQTDQLTIALRNIADVVNLSTGKAYHSANALSNRSLLVSGGQIDGSYVFSGIAFGGCVNENCPAGVDHNVYADVEILALDGTKKTLTADITKPMSEAQNSVTEIAIEVQVEDMGLKAVVTGWTLGAASGEINGSK